MMYQEFNENLKELNLSKKDFAEQVGMNYASVTNWKHSKSLPNWLDSWMKYYKRAKNYEMIKRSVLKIEGFYPKIK